MILCLSAIPRYQRKDGATVSPSGSVRSLSGPSQLLPTIQSFSCPGFFPPRSVAEHLSVLLQSLIVRRPADLPSHAVDRLGFLSDPLLPLHRHLGGWLASGRRREWVHAFPCSPLSRPTGGRHYGLICGHLHVRSRSPHAVAASPCAH